MSININDDINNNYLLFLEKHDLVKFSLVSKWKINRIKKKFAKKCILVIVLNNVHEIHNYTYLNKPLRFNDLEYPDFNNLYILLNTMNFSNEIAVNYYTNDLYFYKIKKYKHNFLVFLAQSFGALEITWSSETINSKNNKISIQSKMGYKNIGTKEEYTKENKDEFSINNVQKLKYDNFGSEIYFETSKNIFSWTDRNIYDAVYEIIKSNSNKSEILRNIEKILFEENIKKLLNKTQYFSYDFYINEPLLVDFVRKRENGMLSINHEMIQSNSHKTILKYFFELGTHFWANLNLNYDCDLENSMFDRTNYYVKFYETESLEAKTLELLLMEKSLNQIKNEQEEKIKNNTLLLKKEIKELNHIEKNIFSNDKTYHLKKYKRLYQLANIKNGNKYSYLKYFKDNINDVIKDFLFVFEHSIYDKKVEKNKINLWTKNIPSDFFSIIVDEIFTDIDINNKFNLLIQDIYQINEKNTLYFSIELMEKSSFYDENNEKHNKIIKNIAGYDNYKTMSMEKKRNEQNKNITKIELFNKINNNNYANCDGVYIKNNIKLINEYPTYVNEEKGRFIGWADGNWVLTGMQWYDEIVEDTKTKKKSFGGFHSSTNEAKSINESMWQEYLIQCDV